ncbi:MAG: ROK family protein [Firmicutes bacterium]|nr:ROK family protein [Bacillota bacterium]
MANRENNPIRTAGPVWLGIDVGGTTVKLALFQADSCDAGDKAAAADIGDDAAAADIGDTAAAVDTGSLSHLTEIGRKVIPTRTENEGKQIMPDIAAAVRSLAEECGIPVSSIEGAGMGVPGPVLNKTDRGYPVAGCVNLNWTDICYPGEELRDLTGIRRICLLNDANAAALGELYFGARGKDASETTAVMITIGTGIGGGIITGGRIITGAFGAAGEVGHMPIVPADPLLQTLRSADSDFGAGADLEYFTSATGIARAASGLLQISGEDSALRTCGEVTAKDVFDAAKQGDSLALQIAEFFFNTLGQGLAAIASVVDPDLFIIGGGVAAAGGYLLDGLQEAYRRQVFHASRKTSFCLAQLGNDAGLLGPLVPLL